MSNATTVVTKIVVDASGALTTVDRYGKAMEGAGQASARTATATEQTHAKIAQLRTAMEQGIPVLKQRVTAISGEERAWVALASKTDALSAMRLKQQREITRAVTVATNAAISGYATEEAAVAAVMRLEAQHATQLQAVGKSAGVASFQTANIASQFQDIAVQLQSGQSPFTIALQQGTQLSSALGTRGGLSAALSSLGAGFASLLSPVSLVTVGVIAFGGLAVQMLGNILPKTESATAALQRHKKSIDEIVVGWNLASEAVDDFIEASQRLPREAVQIKLDAEFGAMRSEVAAFIDQARDLGPVLGGSLNSTDREIGELLQSFTEGQISARDLYVELVRIQSADLGPLAFGIKGLAANLADGALKAAAMADAFVGLAHAIAATGNNGGLQIALDSKLAAERSAQAHQIEMDALNAKSPDQLADIARRRMSLELADDEITEALKLQEITQAGTLAYEQAATALANVNAEFDKQASDTPGKTDRPHVAHAARRKAVWAGINSEQRLLTIRAGRPKAFAAETSALKVAA